MMTFEFVIRKMLEQIRILEAVFRGVEIKATRDVVHHLALNDVLYNLDEEADRDVLAQLLRIDGIRTRFGEYHYAVALAERTALDV